MRSAEKQNGLLAALAFLLLGGCLLLSAAGLLSQAAICRERMALPGGSGRLWYSAAAAPAPAAEDEDGHAHVLPGGGAALVLTDAFDGSRGLAAELARRGTTVLLAGRSVPAEEAWDALRSLCGEQADMALLAGPDRADEALALLSRLRSRGQRCAGAVVLTGAAGVRAAGDLPGGNLLLLTRSRPDEETLTAFYGSQIAAERGFDGFFAENTARACAWDGRFGFFGREALLRVNDWMGSVLGHGPALADDDFLYDNAAFCVYGAGITALLAAAVLIGVFRRRR